MNDFSQVCLSSVVAWIWETIAGINPDEANPGYKHFFIQPRINSKLDYAKGLFDSINEKIVSEWEKINDMLELTVQIPTNTTVTIYIPVKTAESVTENGIRLNSHNDIEYLFYKNDNVVVKVPSGFYRFVSEL